MRFGYKWILVLTLVSCKGEVVLSKPLDNFVLVGDQGHNGFDNGTSASYNGKTVIEAKLNFETAMFIKEEAEAQGAIVLMTLKKVSVTLPDGKQGETEVFTLDGAKAEPSSYGLAKRSMVGNYAVAKYPKHRVVFLSLHHDNLGDITNVCGVQLITAPGSDSLAKALYGEFGPEFMRPINPVIRNNSVEYDRNLRVLRSFNRVPEKVLIELGNLVCPNDLKMSLDKKRQRRFAKMIVNALIKSQPQNLPP
ncbi:MAG: N-acetylmuramoyl-L-alanine amidase [bacterium]|nr:N-acetylmuramoyl-L-alanine amidase [bacterium]